MSGSEWVGLIGTIASLIGLIVTIFAYKRIKQVKSILRQKAMNKAIISNIEQIMRYHENIPLGPNEKRNIENILASIEINLSEKTKKHKFEKAQILAIRKEIADSQPNVKNIKTFFKILKATVATLEEE
ncbi:MAG: hypothetical protein JXR48_03895 [Candidatus Delongbacteria bacterium]|nr:hypothetical protein [Candidatus Delongbacteria bacterium]MBN2834089.1 hypothetical protein [Candidatus Delongbacteria bacterium]